VNPNRKWDFLFVAAADPEYTTAENFWDKEVKDHMLAYASYRKSFTQITADGTVLDNLPKQTDNNYNHNNDNAGRQQPSHQAGQPRTTSNATRPQPFLFISTSTPNTQRHRDLQRLQRGERGARRQSRLPNLSLPRVRILPPTPPSVQPRGNKGRRQRQFRRKERNDEGEGKGRKGKNDKR
jgi:hypothetical protein